MFQHSFNQTDVSPSHIYFFFFLHRTEIYYNTEVVKCKLKEHQKWHLLCRKEEIFEWRRIFLCFYGKERVFNENRSRKTVLLSPVLYFLLWLRFCWLFIRETTLACIIKCLLQQRTSLFISTRPNLSHLIEFKLGQKDIEKLTFYLQW